MDEILKNILKYIGSRAEFTDLLWPTSSDIAAGINIPENIVIAYLQGASEAGLITIYPENRYGTNLPQIIKGLLGYTEFLKSEIDSLKNRIQILENR